MSFFSNDNLDLSNDEFNYYEVLGCNELSNTEQIITEYRIKARTLHPDKNLNDVNATEEFKKLQEAKEVLTNEKMRSEYDAWRHSGLHISFKKWMSMKDVLKVSMHWAAPVKSDPMVEYGESSDPCTSTNTMETPEEDFSETLRKFRNYEI